VGLPLAIEFGKKFSTIGYDIDTKRISELKKGLDLTLETTKEDIINSKLLSFTTNLNDISHCDIFIITVPTPIDKYNKPDMRAIENASKAISKILKTGDTIIYESTVYPGATEEFCVPILEKESGLVFNKDFFCGYSPERINPGDKIHKLTSIKKVTSGSTKETADKVDGLYSKIIEAGTHKVSSIKVAEASKVIENTQRDVNIALINELALIFNKLDLDTEEVLKAAETKWNFLPFRPGLVGGHCIGVDPYYLTHKATEIGYHPEIILAGRRINDSMGLHVAHRVICLMIEKGIDITHPRILILGLTFKENCPDIRNTKVVDIYKSLKKYSSKAEIDIYDPFIKSSDYNGSYINIVDELTKGLYDAIILAVGHNRFVTLGIDTLKQYAKSNHVFYDIKSVFDKNQVDERL